MLQQLRPNQINILVLCHRHLPLETAHQLTFLKHILTGLNKITPLSV